MFSTSRLVDDLVGFVVLMFILGVGVGAGSVLGVQAVIEHLQVHVRWLP